MASGIALKSTNDSIVNIKNVGTATGTTDVTVPNRNMTMGTEITLGTAQATTSGTFKDFTIPSGVKRVAVMFNGVSTNGTSFFLVQLGDSGGIENTGYSGSSASGNTLATGSTSGFIVGANQFIAWFYSGIVQLHLVDGNTFAESGLIGAPTALPTVSSGSKTLSGELDRIRITTVNGTDVFDAGLVNVSWEF